MSSVAVTTGSFQAEVLESPVPVLLDFWAPWCGPCKMIAPVLDQLAEEYKGRLKVGKINVDEEGSLAEMHGVSSIPSLFVYQNGAMAGQRTGAAHKHEIEALFKDFI
jgi:thioredoxin 1